MKTDKHAALRKELMTLPNIGERMADDLVRLGIRAIEDLELEDADEMYDRICRLDGVRHDPCVWDTYAAVIDHARGGPPRKWWEYTRLRKQRDAGAHPTAAGRAKGAAARRR